MASFASVILAVSLAAPGMAQDLPPQMTEARRALEQARTTLTGPWPHGQLPPDGVRQAEEAMRSYEQALQKLQSQKGGDMSEQAIRNARQEILGARQALQQPGDEAGQRAALQSLDDVGIAMAEVEQAAAATPAEAPRTAPVAQTEVEELIGKPARTADGGRLGAISDVVQRNDGQAAAVIDVGPYLGTGRREIAVESSKLRIGASDEVVVDLDREQLATAPVYEPPPR